MANQTNATLIADVRSLFNEPSAMAVSDTDITQFIDDAAIDICAKTGLIKTDTAIVALTSGQFEYSLSTTTPALSDANLIKITDVIYLGNTSDWSTAAAGLSTSRTLSKAHRRQLSHISGNAAATAAIPTDWYQDWSFVAAASAQVLGVWPIPSASGNLLKIVYTTEITRYTDDTNFYIPSWMQDYLVPYAYAKCLERDGKFSQAQQYMSYFDNFIAFARADLGPEMIDSKDMMTQPDFTRVVQ